MSSASVALCPSLSPRLDRPRSHPGCRVRVALSPAPGRS